MSTGTFGAPVQDEALAADNQQQGQQPANGLDHQQVDIDPNDPRLTSETISDDAKADAYATMPPIPDGKWRAKLSKHPDSPKDAKGQVLAAKPGISKRRGSEGQPYLFTALKAEILDPQSGTYDGYQLGDYFVDTQVGRSGTSAVASVTRACKVQTPASASQRQYMDLLLSTLTKEPTVEIETQWEWQCQGCQDLAKKTGDRGPRSVRGMFKFPQVPGKPGQHDPQMKCDTCHTYSVAQPRIVGYAPAK